MWIIELSIIRFFIIWFIFIVFEEKLEIDKTKSALFFWTFSWILIFMSAKFYSLDLENIKHHFDEIILELAYLSLFLTSAMTIISYLSEKNVLTSLAHRVIYGKITKVKLLFLLWFFTFIFSWFADNLTATLVSVSILLSIKALSEDKNDLIIFSIFIIFAANSGWVALITWDVTTLMIFLANKVDIISLLYLFIPSFLWFMLLYFLLINKLKWSVEIVKSEYEIEAIDIKIFLVFLVTIISIIFFHIIFHIPPVLVFLFWLSIIFLLWWKYKKIQKQDLEILHFLNKVEYNTIFFFLWVLLMVWALDFYNLLENIWYLYEIFPYYIASFFVWILSSIVDNIPLTAAMLKADLAIDRYIWLDITYAVWVWWSLTLIWSAAWVIAMSKVKQLTFISYLRYFPHIALAYLTWYIATVLISRFI